MKKVYVDSIRYYPKSLYDDDEVANKEIKQIALDLIAKEENNKYQKKYARVWK